MAELGGQETLVCRHLRAREFAKGLPFASGPDSQKSLILRIAAIGQKPPPVGTRRKPQFARVLNSKETTVLPHVVGPVSDFQKRKNATLAVFQGRLYQNRGLEH